MATWQHQPFPIPSAQRAAVGAFGRNCLFDAWTYRYLYLMLVLPFVFFIIFRFYPMFGNIIAFKKYQLMHGIWGSPWVGFKHFNTLFDDPAFLARSPQHRLHCLIQVAFHLPRPHYSGAFHQ